MAFIPHDAKWYLAELVEEIQIEGEVQNVVHINLTLIRADSPEEAYKKTQELGKESEISYQNPQEKLVTINFQGLRDLNVIHDELGHGAELIYEEKIGLTKDEIEQIVRSKDELGVFQPIEKRGGPDYTSKEVEEMAQRLLGKDFLRE